MSSPERRAVLKAQREAVYAAEEAERHRRASLSIFERIDEAKDLEDIKEILHALARAAITNEAKAANDKQALIEWADKANWGD